MCVAENCTENKLHFEKVFSVPGDMAMLSSTMVSTYVTKFKTLPYNITWYASNTSQEMSNLTSRILILGESLWFLNVTMDYDGEYMSILRTPSHCYRQATKLVVTLPVTGQCERPEKTIQTVWRGAYGTLSCPMKDVINKLNSYNISTSLTWYRGCDTIEPNDGRYTFRDTTFLMINNVQDQDNGSYTCTLKFTLGGIPGSMSETIHANVIENYSLTPQIHEPANEIIRTHKGSNFSKRCQVFVPGNESPTLTWWAQDKMIFKINPNERVHVSRKSKRGQDFPKGIWIERWLYFSEVTEMDFHINYTCKVQSSRGQLEGYFLLLPADPSYIITIGSLGGVIAIVFVIVFIYCVFKVDIVLWFRRVFPVFYTNKDLDGRLYDAYVAYSQMGAVGFSKEVESFALHTLPLVLENACGYKLFIAGRDCLPGQTLIDSVEENIQASRCLLLLYTASTFTSQQHMSSTSSNNNKIINNGNISNNRDSKTKDNGSCRSFDVSDELYPDTRHHLEFVTGMNKALLEASLKVILVEMEEITPAQLALFPESVRHLRKKQGAMCWWKNLKKKQSGRTYFSKRDDEEKCEQDTCLSPSLSQSSRFWKEMRYHMPVKGMRAVYPEKTALSNL